MENVISRVRNTANLIVLVVVLLLQVIGLAIQVKRTTETGTTRLIRVWTISILSPMTKGVVHTEGWFSNTWRNYVWFRGVRQENEDLKDQIVQMKMREVRLIEDANQARRLQHLLGFKEHYISKTVPAQVISTTGSEFSRALYIDKGSNDGIETDMPVVSPEGVVGKVLRVFSSTSLVLLINDPTSGAGVILENSRLQGIVKGSPSANGAILMRNVMSDEKVEVGERVLTSGGDRVFPKGMLLGTIQSVNPGQELFLNIRVRPAAPINRLEEVLVITKIDERAPDSVAANPVRAIDVLAERLPTVAPPAPKPDANKTPAELAAKPGADKKPVPAELKPAPKSTQTNASTETVKPVKQAQTAPANKPVEVEPKDTPR
jgi:rod shape-determining protein MreC